MKKLLFIGYGNMAKAIGSGIIESGLAKEYEITIIGRDETKAQALCEFLRTSSKTENLHINALKADSHIDVQDCEVLLCVKPHAFSAFAYNGEASIVYSVMAGIGIKNLHSHINARNVVRIMPNVGALHRQSASCVYIKNPNTDKERIIRLVESFGNCVLVDNEDLIDSSIATSGSSPAFLALIAESLIDCGVYNGLTHSQSAELVAQTFKGFATLLANTSPKDIKTSITSPSGTTARGLAVLEKCAVRGAIMQAGIESINRAKELGKL